jgi:hypothetical protein
LAATGTTVAAASSLLAANPTTAIGMVDAMQTLSFMSYVNRKNAMGFDESNKNLNFANPNTIFKPPTSWLPSSHRLLQIV